MGLTMIVGGINRGSTGTSVQESGGSPQELKHSYDFNNSSLTSESRSTITELMRSRCNVMSLVSSAVRVSSC